MSEDHESRQSQIENPALQKFSQNFVKFNSEILEETKDDIFQCSLCLYRTSIKIDLNDHWLTNCVLQTREDEIKNVTRFLCGGCGAPALTTDDMKTHWQVHCTVYVRQEVGQEPVTDLMAGTYVAKQEEVEYGRGH